ncbi:MAG TPA: cyclic lactone autoinducer peptide [Clostridiales bacterium]|nr:cyclic lactone autoinducer peptide [Clostridiales bacterium]
MKNLRKFLLKGGSLLASVAFLSAAASYGTTCIYIFHQPQEPEALKRFAKN